MKNSFFFFIISFRFTTMDRCIRSINRWKLCVFFTLPTTTVIWYFGAKPIIYQRLFGFWVICRWQKFCLNNAFFTYLCFFLCQPLFVIMNLRAEGCKNILITNTYIHNEVSEWRHLEWSHGPLCLILKFRLLLIAFTRRNIWANQQAS